MQTIEGLMREWQERRAPVNTARTNATNVAPVEVICEKIGTMTTSFISTHTVETFRNSLLDHGLSKVTVARYLSVLRAGCNGHLDHIPLGKLISELKRGPNQIDIWTKEEAHKIINHSFYVEPHPQELSMFTEFLFATGCRRGEALSVERGDVDLHRERIHFHRSLSLDGSTQNGTKWGGERHFPLSDKLQDMIESYSPESGRLFPYLDQRTVGRYFKSACEKADVPQHKMHCTRHSAISWALAGGVTLRKASEIFGVSQGTLEKHYAHFVDEEIDMSWAQL